VGLWMQLQWYYNFCHSHTHLLALSRLTDTVVSAYANQSQAD